MAITTVSASLAEGVRRVVLERIDGDPRAYEVLAEALAVDEGTVHSMAGAGRWDLELAMKAADALNLHVSVTTDVAEPV